MQGMPSGTKRARFGAGTPVVVIGGWRNDEKGVATDKGRDAVFEEGRPVYHDREMMIHVKLDSTAHLACSRMRIGIVAINAVDAPSPFGAVGPEWNCSRCGSHRTHSTPCLSTASQTPLERVRGHGAGVGPRCLSTASQTPLERVRAWRGVFKQSSPEKLGGLPRKNAMREAFLRSRVIT